MTLLVMAKLIIVLAMVGTGCWGAGKAFDNVQAQSSAHMSRTEARIAANVR